MNYSTKVISYNPIAYWQLNDKEGDVAIDVSGNGFHGTYNNVTLGQTGIGDGTTSPLFNGTNGYVDIYSTGFRDAFDTNEGSFSIWAKVYNINCYSAIHVAMILAVSGINTIYTLTYPTVGEDYSVRRSSSLGGGGGHWTPPVGDLNWINIILTWSVLNDECYAYLNGLEVVFNVMNNDIYTIIGNIVQDTTNIGAYTQGALGYPWHGWLAHAAVFDYALESSKVFDLSKIPVDTYEEPIEKIELTSGYNTELLETSTFNTELDLESTFDTEADIYGKINIELELESKINLEDI